MSVWHAKSARQTLEQLETDKVRGLSGEEAERRLGRYGPNRLQGTKRESLPRRFFGQMKDPMILVLLAAAALPLTQSSAMQAAHATTSQPSQPNAAVNAPHTAATTALPLTNRFRFSIKHPSIRLCTVRHPPARGPGRLPKPRPHRPG